MNEANANTELRIHDVKKNIKILISELEKMQNDSTNEVDHYQSAYALAKWLDVELQNLFPAKRNSLVQFSSGVLIDDDSIFAAIWNQAGAPFGKSVRHYPNGSSFIKDSQNFPKDTFIYIDWFLEPTKPCTELIQKLVSMGFTNLVITTNATNIVIPEFPSIPIISKNPPWFSS